MRRAWLRYGELARKPPLFYWLAGAVAAATEGHVDEARAQIVSVIAGTAVAIVTLLWTTAFIDSTTGWLAFLFLLGCYAFTSRGTLALEDMTLVAFMFAGWCLLYPAIEAGPSPHRTIGIGVLLGLGILTKGPVAIVLPAFATVIYLLDARRPITPQLRQRWPWMVLLIAVAIALPWYVAAMAIQGREVARIIYQENAGHFLVASAGGTGEAARPSYFIALKMLGGITPVNFLLPALLLALVRSDFVGSARKPLLFQLSFLLAVLIFLSAASAKREDYILPGIPCLAILLAPLFTSLPPSQYVEMLRDLAALIVAALAVLVLEAALLGTSIGHSALLAGISRFDRAQAQLLLRVYFASISLLFVAVALPIVGGAALVISGVLRKHPLRTAVGIGSISLIGVLMFTAVLRPEISRQRTLKYVAQDIDRIASDAPIYVVHENEGAVILPRTRGAGYCGAPGDSSGGAACMFAYEGDFRGVAASLREARRLYRGYWFVTHGLLTIPRHPRNRQAITSALRAPSGEFFRPSCAARCE